ncbi:MAG: efflux RND transporter permease subunit, partial [Pseudomonadales bacterium]|nr:efflux RND transporter permease subunit [Pseudomonadales bacterium]
MKIAQASIQYRAAVAVVVCLVMLFGYLGVSRMPLQLLPDISEPRITIFNNWRSAAPQELEEAIIQPQEQVLRSNTGLTEIVANTQRGSGSLTLTYRHGQDMDAAMLAVLNRLNQAPPLP